jgi:hypothetical protein
VAPSNTLKNKLVAQVVTTVCSDQGLTTLIIIEVITTEQSVLIITRKNVVSADLI